MADKSQRNLSESSLLEVPTLGVDLSGRCRYNLRNRGPPMFTVLAEKECPICLSDVFEKPVVVNCGHTFCLECIKLSMVKHKSCPICNQVLITELFLADTNFTRKLTKRDRSLAPVKVQEISSVGKDVNVSLPVGTRSSSQSKSRPASRRANKSTNARELRKMRT